MKRSAFTMLELVFVIIVVGILAVLAMPDFRSNQLQQAAEQIAAHIRYTQHLALVDDKYDTNDALWWQERWQIWFPYFTPAGGERIYYYEVFSDKNHLGNSNSDEEAIDPLTKESIGNGSATVATLSDSSTVNLTKRYGINGVGGNCIAGGAYKPIAFDSLGRPYQDVYSGVYSNSLPQTGCSIYLQHKSDGNATITIRPETGYVSVSYN